MIKKPWGAFETLAENENVKEKNANKSLILKVSGQTE